MKVGPSPVAGLCRKQGGSGTETQAQATGCKDVIARRQPGRGKEKVLPERLPREHSPADASISDVKP